MNDTRQKSSVKEEAKERARAKRLMDNYRLTVEQYETILRYQNGVCYICGQPEPVKGRRLSVDHDHDTGLIRGLLCSRCNPIIGKLENAFKRYGLGKVSGFDAKAMAVKIGDYLWVNPASKALGIDHFGYTGRTGTKKHRARLRKEKKKMTLLIPPVQRK